MAKKISKFLRIGVEGDTCDGRIIGANDIQEMAETFDPRVYGCRINLEHIKGVVPGTPFERYGDVVEVKAEQISDDSILNGKWALFAKIAPLDNLVEMVGKGQKVYTSMEVDPNFAKTGKCRLVGLAVTDDPASLGVEYMEFCRNSPYNPLSRFKSNPENLISAAVEANIEFEDQQEGVLTALTDKVKAIFSRKQADDDARLRDVHEAVTAVSEHVQENLTAANKQLASLQGEFNQLKAELSEKVEQSVSELSQLKTELSSQEQFGQQRPPATGGDGQTVQTDC